MPKVYHIIQPGTFLKTKIHPRDRQKNIKKFDAENAKNFKVTMALKYLMDTYYEANISLNLFKDSQSELEECHKICFTGKKKLKEPKEFYERMPYMHAKTFIYSLDIYKGHLNYILELNQQNDGIREAFNKFKDVFSELKYVRNSAHHLEQRARGKSKDQKIEVKPLSRDDFEVKNGNMSHLKGFVGESNFLVTESLNGNVFGITNEEGGYSKVAVSEESMLALQSITQTIFDSLDWQQGDSQKLPTPLL